MTLSLRRFNCWDAHLRMLRENEPLGTPSARYGEPATLEQRHLHLEER